MKLAINHSWSKPKSWLPRPLAAIAAVTFFCLLGRGDAAQKTPSPGTPPAGKARTFAMPQQAAQALIDAAEKYDLKSLEEILGPSASDILNTGEPVRDKELAVEFAGRAREANHITVDPKTRSRAFLLVGSQDWPFPVPLVRRAGRWSFDARQGRQEILYRRIGRNELDAVQICRGYVEAQHDYALLKRGDSRVNQYAQRIISSPGKQDGLAWQDADGKWDGPVGENAARAFEKGYTATGEPFHGYFFKVLKGQGPAAPLGEMYFMVKGVMIGGFALVASPATYGVTGVKSFIVSHDGIVYEKDLGPETLGAFRKMELFNPDKTWSPVLEP